MDMRDKECWCWRRKKIYAWRWLQTHFLLPITKLSSNLCSSFSLQFLSFTSITTLYETSAAIFFLFSSSYPKLASNTIVHDDDIRWTLSSLFRI